MSSSAGVDLDILVFLLFLARCMLSSCQHGNGNESVISPSSDTVVYDFSEGSGGRGRGATR